VSKPVDNDCLVVEPTHLKNNPGTFFFKATNLKKLSMIMIILVSKKAPFEDPSGFGKRW